MAMGIYKKPLKIKYSKDFQIHKLSRNIKRAMLKPRAISSIYLYNMLQDFRHLLIFDLRKPQNYEQHYIRDSFNVNE